MPRYEDAGISFDTPQHWKDRSIVSYAAPTASGGCGPNIVMMRLPLGSGDLDTVHQRVLQDFSNALPDFRLLGGDERNIAGRAARLLRFTFTGEQGPIEQTVVHIDPAPEDTDKRLTLMVFTTSATGELRTDFEEILRSIRFPPPAKKERAA